MKGVVLIAVFLLAEGFIAEDLSDTMLYTSESSRQEMKHIVAVDPDKVRLELAMDPLAILIDVRMKFEFRRSRIGKAVHLPKKKDLDVFASSTLKHRPLYLYCTTETRARQAGELLVAHGFEKVYVIEGGFNKWKAYNLPVERGRTRAGGGR
jgi:rhodanese-related sulfurtransferase